MMGGDSRVVFGGERSRQRELAPSFRSGLCKAQQPLMTLCQRTQTTEKRILMILVFVEQGFD
jgi:hypothetical protein